MSHHFFLTTLPISFVNVLAGEELDACPWSAVFCRLYIVGSIKLCSVKIVGVIQTLWMSAVLFMKRRFRAFSTFVGWYTICTIKCMLLKSCRDSACISLCWGIPERMWPSGHFTYPLKEICAVCHPGWVILLSFLGGSGGLSSN